MADKQPRIVRFDGKTYRLPADATEAEISALFGAVPAANAPHVPEKAKTWTELGSEVLTGAAKGLASTTRGAVSIIPGVEAGARTVGNYLGGKAGEALYGTKAEPVTSEQATAGLKPTTSAEKVGYGAEQIGEFFVPAGAARKAAIEGLVRAIPNAANPATMKMLNKAAAIAGRTIGEAGSAGTVAALQGSEHPELAAATAGAGPLVGAGAQAAAQILKYPLTKNMVAMIVGAGGAQLAGPIASMGASFGAYGLSRSLAKRILSQPGMVQRIGGLARTGNEEAARLIAAITAAATDKDEE